MPLRFTVVSNVEDVELYSFAVQIPDEVKIADLGPLEVQVFDKFFKNRWVVFTLFDYEDPFLGMVHKGLNIVADSDAQIVGRNIAPQLEWLQTLVNYTIPSIRFSTSVPLAILSLIPYFTGRALPQGITFETLQSLIRLKAVIVVNKILYRSDKNSGITEIKIDSCDITGRWGVQERLKRVGFDISNLFNFGFGVTMKVKAATGPEMVIHGGIDIKPLTTVLHGRVDGDIKNPFGIPWISFHNIGFDFPLTVGGAGIIGVGIRGQAGLGKSRFEIAGKADLGVLKKSALLLHGQVEKIPFAAFTQFIKNDNQIFGWLKPLELDHAQVTIACGDTTIAQREFKSGITVRGQVSNPLLDKKAGFQLYAYNTGTYYQFFGNGYLPEVHTKFITFEGQDGKGPRLEFNYAFDFAFEKFIQSTIKANGRVRIGSLFEGVADINMSTITLARNVIIDWKNFLIALFREQKIVVKGKLFNTFSAELHILESKDKDVYIKIGFSQELLSAWEKTLRETVVKMKNFVQGNIESIDKKIEKLTANMDENAKDALERAAELTEENNELKRANSEIQDRIKKTPWKEIYKVIPLRAKQGYNATMIASNADLLNTILIHGSFTEKTVSTLGQLRKAKNKAVTVVETIAKIATLEIGVLGIERIEAHGWLDQIMHQRQPLLLTVGLKVMGQERIISNIPFDGARPIDSAKNLMRIVIAEIIGDNVSGEISIDVPMLQLKARGEGSDRPTIEQKEEGKERKLSQGHTYSQNLIPPSTKQPLPEVKQENIRQKKDLRPIKKPNGSFKKEDVKHLSLTPTSTKKSWTQWLNERGNLLIGGMQLGTAAIVAAGAYLFYKDYLLSLQSKK